VYDDRTFTFIMKNPPASRLILKALGIEKGSSKSQKERAVGTLTKEMIAKIVAEKMPDLNANSPEAAGKLIAGTAQSMGIDVK
jgi:large subunit ribosomal protein L11